MAGTEGQQPMGDSSGGISQSLVQRIFDQIGTVQQLVNDTKTDLVREMGAFSRAHGVLETSIQDMRQDVDRLSKQLIGNGESLPTRVSLLERSLSDHQKTAQKDGQEKVEHRRSMRIIRWQMGGTLLVCAVTLIVSFLH